MERVAFLVERTGERIACMLNPESVVLRRWAGVRPLRATGGIVAGSAVTDDPLVQSGGGTTELLLDLLFDISLADAATPIDNVRDLTQPLWKLTESGENGRTEASVVRFVWGKSWNVRAVIAAIAERLESFDGNGAPGRSWLRMRLLRVDDEMAMGDDDTLAPPLAGDAEETQVHEVPPNPELDHALDWVGGDGDAGDPGGPPDDEPSSARLDELAYLYYGDPGLWKKIAAINDIDDPLHVAAGALLRMPPRDEVEASS